MIVSNDSKNLKFLLSNQEQELKTKEKELESTKRELYQMQEHGEKIEANLEVLRRKHLSKSSLKVARRIIWERTMKIVDLN